MAVVGSLLAATAAVVIGAVTLTRDPGPSFPAGPTASRITVAPEDFPIPETELRALLSAPAELGALTDPVATEGRLGVPKELPSGLPVAMP